MTSFVLDSSTTLSWFMPNETASLDLLKKTVKEGAIVPTIWLLEIGNVLLDFFRNSLMLRDLKETRNAEPQRTLMSHYWTKEMGWLQELVNRVF